MISCFPQCAHSVHRSWALSKHATEKYLDSYLRGSRHMCEDAEFHHGHLKKPKRRQMPISEKSFAQLEAKMRLFCYCCKWSVDDAQGRLCVSEASMRYEEMYDEQMHRTPAPTAASAQPTASPTMSAAVLKAQAEKRKKLEQEALAAQLLQAMGLKTDAAPLPRTQTPTPAPTVQPTAMPTAFEPLPPEPGQMSADDDGSSAPTMDPYADATADPTQSPTVWHRNQAPAPAPKKKHGADDDDDTYVDNSSEDQQFDKLLKPKKPVLPLLPALTPVPTPRATSNANMLKEKFFGYLLQQGVGE